MESLPVPGGLFHFLLSIIESRNPVPKSADDELSGPQPFSDLIISNAADEKKMLGLYIHS